MPTHTLPTYLVQCISGHVYNALVGSYLESDCKKREADGFLDALILTHDECEECLQDAITQARRTYRALCGDWGCMGDCGSSNPDECRGKEDIKKYQLLLDAAEKRNRYPVPT